MKVMTKEEAVSEFNFLFPRNEFPKETRAEAWKRYIDSLMKSDMISENQVSKWSSPF